MRTIHRRSALAAVVLGLAMLVAVPRTAHAAEHEHDMPDHADRPAVAPPERDPASGSQAQAQIQGGGGQVQIEWQKGVEDKTSREALDRYNTNLAPAGKNATPADAQKQ